VEGEDVLGVEFAEDEEHELWYMWEGDVPEIPYQPTPKYQLLEPLAAWHALYGSGGNECRPAVAPEGFDAWKPYVEKSTGKVSGTGEGPW